MTDLRALWIEAANKVYYLDLRPNMTSDSILKEQIRTFDTLLCADIWKHV